MASEDLFSKALENPTAALDLSLPKDDVDTGIVNSSSENEEAEEQDESSSSSSSDDDSDRDEKEDGGSLALEEDDDEDPSPEGAIRSKHEIVEEPIPDVPEDYSIDEKATLSEIGVIKSAFDNNIVIHSLGSGERRVLKEGSILCLEDRTLIGSLCEVFGKLEDPFYRVSLPSSKQAQFNDLKERIGQKVFIVVPEAHWVDTFELRRMKGTDASNGYDEELSEEDQEFSDDEKEALFKKMKKEQRKKKNVNTKELREKIESGNIKRPKQQQQQQQQQHQHQQPHFPKMQPPAGMSHHGYRSRNTRQEDRKQQLNPRSYNQSPPSMSPMPYEHSAQTHPSAHYQQPFYPQQSQLMQQPLYFQPTQQLPMNQQYAPVPLSNPQYQQVPAPAMPYGQQQNLHVYQSQQQSYPNQPYYQQQHAPSPLGQYIPPSVPNTPQSQHPPQQNMQHIMQLHSLLMQQGNLNQNQVQKKQFDYDD